MSDVDRKLVILRSVVMWAEDAWEHDPTEENLVKLNKAREELRQYWLSKMGEP
jgi:hypothetical protein